MSAEDPASPAECLSEALTWMTELVALVGREAAILALVGGLAAALQLSPEELEEAAQALREHLKERKKGAN